ncbi:ankyrin repeat domain-containing protein [Solitalea lacus]|uniref:ankyrin repeat domain-containing protein n=1 Tax=Solitalea lacus TaxID=2911172 RepID=UPI001ED9F4B4|nr:ankyrin repeat domain-containing protein [Solitalea lacus]UKJ08595.1 ankyrin repeat domain-containing protein [Solitalea lacus]
MNKIKLVLSFLLIIIGHLAIAQKSSVPSEKAIEEFYDAIFADNNEKVKQLLVNKYFPASYEPRSKTSPLRAAIWQKNITVIKWLVEGGANINSKEQSAVIEAAERGELKILEYLISKGGDIKNTEAFSKAGANNNYDCARLLLLKGANQELGSIDGKLKVLETATRRSDYEVLNVLRLNKEEINANNCEGETSLIIAVKMNNVSMVKYLLRLGADKNKPETYDCGDDIYYGEKPIKIAKKLKHVEIVKLLS